MIGILGGMGTQAGLDFCNKLAILYRGKFDQDYPLFILYNKSNIPGRPESIGVQTGNLSNKRNNKNPLPNDGLNNLANLNFRSAVYLYNVNFETAPTKIESKNGNVLNYYQIGGNLSLIHI